MMLSQCKRIVFFGECMVEHRADNSCGFGGDTYNAAWYLSQILRYHAVDNVQVFYASAIGREPASLQFKAHMKSANIVDDFIVTQPTKLMGQYWVYHDQNGERQFRFARCESAAKTYFECNEQLTKALLTNQVDVIYLSGISLAILNDAQRTHLLNTLAVFKFGGGQILFDNNYRPSLWMTKDNVNEESRGLQQSKVTAVYLAAMRLADIAFLTDEDEFAVYGTDSCTDIIHYHHEQHCDINATLVIRRGSAPCVVKVKHQVALKIEAQRIESNAIVDTCAAGDSFAGAFLAHFLEHNNLEHATHYAHRVAACVIQYHGALMPHHFLPKFVSQEYLSEP